MTAIKQNTPTVRGAPGISAEMVPPAADSRHKWWPLAQWAQHWQAQRAAARERRAAEAVERAELKRRKELRRQLEDEAYFYMERITNVTARMSSLSYRYKKSERDLFESGVQTIRFSDVVLQPEAIYLRVDTVRIPRNVSLQSLADDEALFNFSMACQHKVLCEYGEERGFWFIVERQSGVRGIPVHVRLDEIWSMRGPTHDGLSIPIGIGENKRPVWRSLTQMLSLLVAGTPGSGKSNLLNVALCTWIRFNSPHRLKLVLVDMKGGMEFGPYAEIPHLMRYRPQRREEMDGDEDETALDESIVQNADDEDDDGMLPGLVENPANVLPLLRAVHREGRRRTRLLRQAGERGINTYNWHHPKQALPHIVVVIDELAELNLLPSKDADRVGKMLVSIGQVFRAVGIHLVLATQTPKKEVIGITLKNAIPGRLAFNCPDVTASMLIIGNGQATGLSPAGRCILDWNGRHVELQTPLIPDRVISSVIDGAIRGEYEEFELKRHDVTEEEIFKVALDEFAGGLPADQMYRWFNNRQRHIPRQEVRDIISAYIGKAVTIGTSVYQVQSGSGGKPPYLVAVEEE